MLSDKGWAKIPAILLIVFFYPIVSWFFPVSAISDYVLVYSVLAPMAVMVLASDLPDKARPGSPKSTAKIMSAVLLVLFTAVSFLAVYEIRTYLFATFWCENPYAYATMSLVFRTVYDFESEGGAAIIAGYIYYLALASLFLGSLCWLACIWRDRISAIPFFVAGVMSGTFRCVYYLRYMNFEGMGDYILELHATCVKGSILFSSAGLLCAILWNFIYKAFINGKIRNQKA